LVWGLVSVFGIRKKSHAKAAKKESGNEFTAASRKSRDSSPQNPAAAEAGRFGAKKIARAIAPGSGETLTVSFDLTRCKRTF
jgi:hypothetical protein